MKNLRDQGITNDLLGVNVDERAQGICNYVHCEGKNPMVGT